MRNGQIICIIGDTYIIYKQSIDSCNPIEVCTFTSVPNARSHPFMGVELNPKTGTAHVQKGISMGRIYGQNSSFQSDR